MRKQTLGIALIAAGLTLTATAAALGAVCRVQAAQAGEDAQLLLNALTQELEQQREAELYEPTPVEPSPAAGGQPLSWNGYELSGILRIPRLGLELPVMRTWSYELLRVSPCRYSGSAEGGNLILLAHNYPAHFGRLSELAAGDTVELEDIGGTVYRYEVAASETLGKAEPERLTAPGYPLTLFTCTPGGLSRYVVRCK